MEFALEIVEKKYRDTPAGHKKYTKRLTQYINHLISKGRVLEAKHFFVLLNKEKPNHPTTIRLGYTLSIASFDTEGVRHFDKLLCGLQLSEIELMWFRLKFYLSVNNKIRCEECCIFLLSKIIKKEYLHVIIEACLKLKIYAVAAELEKYLKKEKLMLSVAGSRELKEVVIQRLFEIIKKVEHVKISSTKDS